MYAIHSRIPLRLAIAMSAILGSGAAPAGGFLEDSHANLSLRNFYFNQDNREGHAGQTEEWGQGLRLDVQSGFTEGSVGVGVDAIGLLGLRLDGGGRAGKAGQSRTPSALFPLEHDGSARDEYSSLGLTAKLRYSASEARFGTLIPRLPVIKANDGRLLPQTFEGAQLSVREFDDMTLLAGRLRQAKGRSQSHRDDLSVNGANSPRKPGNAVSAAPARHSDAFDFFGLDYQLNRQLQLQYYLGQLEDFYRQHFLGVNHEQPLPLGTLKTDLRHFDTRAIGKNASRSGRAQGYTAAGYYDSGNDPTGTQRGKIDNRAWSALFTWAIGPHALAAGYQRLSGDSNFIQPNQGNGSDLYLITDRQLNSFARAGERTWLAQYGLDFSAWGLPGLSSSVAYLKGTGIRSERGRLEEWERDFTLGYVLQSGPAKGLGVTWRNASLRSGASTDTDQNRVFLTYSLPLF